jgi:peptidoglycan/LPS O-acetylase OafA/YrhL
MKFRKDIEGLRAVAVLPVLLFHGGFDRLHGFAIAPGGYVGVDIFFVISGYLVTGLIFKEMTDGSGYSIARFYARRIMRIFPAVFAVYLFCLIAGAMTASSAEMDGIKTTVLSSTFFVSNIYFAGKSGYFDGGLSLNPLLHTWSLSVEEQFYLFLPPILLCLRRLERAKVVVIVAVAAVVSLIYSQILLNTNPTLAYYDIFARAWELLLGSLVALVGPRQVSSRLAHALAIMGIVAITIAVVLYDRDTVFPGTHALLPCVGAVLVIFSGNGQRTLATRLLELSPVRFVGRISYSLYLWHWPFIVFGKLWFSSRHSVAIGALLASFLAAYLSWRFIEQPVRRLGGAARRSVVLAGGGVGIAAICGLAFMADGVNAAVFPPSVETRRLDEFSRTYQAESGMREGQCFLTSRSNDLAHFDAPACIGYRSGRANMLVLGDSHGAEYWSSLDKLLPGANVMQGTSGGCLMVLGGGGDRRCTDLWRFLQGGVLRDHRLDAIFLGGYWKMGSIPQVMKTAEWLSHHAGTVYIIGPAPVYETGLPRLLIRAHYDGVRVVERHNDPEQWQIDDAFMKQKWPANIVYLSYMGAMCDRARHVCPTVASDGNPVIFDDNHLTQTGALDVVKVWLRNRLIVSSPVLH